ncbi:NAD P-binding protein [Gloeophyllum trabeum ATCC 11539]|uniref:NAD P-binding protein n=1 Tax=Gloeophyllum trabeum (strain ATCC 11539 / FP-39264 / Madison 617) TaxID=670483 RepID=S7PU60_GLOTA|nr:NAD P-binding protein [Gloeophyllum trabeum ATCC 11539]EPQ50867.1 NAD P-binding protein [Gloeophyllum trabeum ATCC 11539]
MKVFVTGASGFIGSTLVPKLIASGHQVTGLARSPSSIAKLESLGAKAVSGDITDLETVAKAAKDADVVVHLAFDHGMAFSGDWAGACEKDRKVIAAICDALLASGGDKKRFILAAGTLGLPPNANEQSELHRSPDMPRWQSTDLAFSYAPKGLSVIQVRIAPITYGPAELNHPFLLGQIEKIKENGYVAYPDSDRFWGTATVDDIADLFFRAVEIAPGKLPNPATLHGLGEDGVPLRDIAEVLGRRLGKETKVIPTEKLGEELGFVGGLQAVAFKASAEWTKQQTGWKPNGKGLLEQLELYEIA